MILPLGAGLLFVGTFALWMMNVTGVIPRRLFGHSSWRKEHDPKAWRRYTIAYGAMAGVGGLLLAIGLMARL